MFAFHLLPAHLRKYDSLRNARVLGSATIEPADQHRSTEIARHAARIIAAKRVATAMYGHP